MSQFKDQIVLITNAEVLSLDEDFVTLLTEKGNTLNLPKAIFKDHQLERGYQVIYSIKQRADGIRYHLIEDGNNYKEEKIESIMLFLIRLNNKLYNYPSHIIILIFLALALFSKITFLKYWILIGLIIYLVLFSMRLLQGDKPKSTLLGYLVGFNICLVLGPISILIFYFLNKIKE